MTGIIDVGGGLRGIYGAGVCDGLLDLDIHLDCCIGISAGSANMVSYIARQRGRNYTFFHDYVFRKDYMSMHNLIKDGSYINFDYIYGTLSRTDGENPLDYDAIVKYNGIFKIVATDAVSGKPVFFDYKESITRDNYSVFGASCCIPVINKPVIIDEKPYYDGGVALPIPIDYAFEELNCNKVIVVLTLPRDYRKEAGIDAKAGFALEKNYPVVADLLVTRAARYNRQVEKCLKLEKEGKVLVVAPDDTCGIDTLSKTPEGLDELYNKGVADAAVIKEFIKK